jgi:hypothetical protein
MAAPGSKLSLPYIMALASGPGEPARVSAAAALHIWRESTSNLCVLYGKAGAGKTTLLRDFAAETHLGAARDGLFADFESCRSKGLEEGQPALLILDNFDSVNSITGHQTSYPDLSSLSPALEQGARIVVATRRDPSDSADELGAQLSSELRWARLHARQPMTISLQPWSLDELQAWADGEAGDESAAHRTVAYLKQHRDMLGEDFRGPLILGMLMRVHDRLSARTVPITIAELFDEYTAWALSLDYDLRRSGFKERHKRQILGNVAYDIFSGAPGTDTSIYAVSRNRLAERVMEAVTQEPSLRATIPEPQYAWLQDFVDTNHMMASIDDGTLDPQVRQFQFVHPSLFEYFVARAMLARLRAGSSLGIRPIALSEATFRSMVLYFVREGWSQAIEDAVAGVASRRLSWPDRLLLLYTMEMSPQFDELLNSCRDEYFDELESHLSIVQSSFIQKAMKYQLILQGRYDPFVYVEEVRSSEQAAETAAERWLHARASFDPTASLLDRLDNPNLRRAAPVAVYRLGQMGNVEAVARLNRIANDLNADVRFRSLAEQALKRIRERVGPDGREMG